MQLDRHPLNSRSKFSSTIDINNLNFLSDDSLEVAIKSIMLDTDASHNIIESVSEIPDIVLVHTIDKSDSVLGLMQIGMDNVMTEFGANEKIEYEDKTYIFDERSDVYELGGKALKGLGLRQFPTLRQPHYREPPRGGRTINTGSPMGR